MTPFLFLTSRYCPQDIFSPERSHHMLISLFGVKPYLPSAKEQHNYLTHLDHTLFIPTSRSAGTPMLIPQGYIEWMTVPLGIRYSTGYLIPDPPAMACNLIGAIRILTTIYQKLILLAPRWSFTLEIFCIPPPFFLPIPINHKRSSRHYTSLGICPSGRICTLTEMGSG